MALQLYPRGPAESLNDYYIHLCAASLRLWIYSRKSALKATQKVNRTFTGSREGASQKGTGQGFLCLPEELNAKVYPLFPDPDLMYLAVADTIGKWGALEAKRHFWSYETRDATPEEDKYSGIDFWVRRSSNERWYSFDVKARWKNYRYLCVQTHEANPDHRYE